jgi:FAD/FMN-containing dehydrogenase
MTGSVLLRARGLDHDQVDPDQQVVCVGAGATGAEVTAAAWEQGLVALAGSAPDDGVAGYLLGGGVGWLVRRWRPPRGGHPVPAAAAPRRPNARRRAVLAGRAGR